MSCYQALGMLVVRKCFAKIVYQVGKVKSAAPESDIRHFHVASIKNLSISKVGHIKSFNF